MESYHKWVKMKLRYQIYLAIILLFKTELILFAQNDNKAQTPIQLTIPPSASISLSGSNLRLSINKNNGTVQTINPSDFATVWINYSSVVEFGSSNIIRASIVSNEVPAELVIKLKIGPDVGSGFGKAGTPMNTITLSTYPQPIISNIGTCYTGQGPNKGHSLTYSWELRPEYGTDFLTEEDIKDLEIGVIYTISNGD